MRIRNLHSDQLHGKMGGTAVAEVEVHVDDVVVLAVGVRAMII